MNKIKFLRRISGVTQDTVAEKTGIDRSTVSRIERGFRRPTEEQKTKLSEFFDMESETVFPGGNQDE